MYKDHLFIFFKRHQGKSFLNDSNAFFSKGYFWGYLYTSSIIKCIPLSGMILCGILSQCISSNLWIGSDLGWVPEGRKGKPVNAICIYSLRINGYKKKRINSCLFRMEEAEYSQLAIQWSVGLLKMVSYQWLNIVRELDIQSLKQLNELS